MGPYFAKFEQCLYIDEYRGFLSTVLGWFYTAFLAVMRFINPKSVLDGGGHGHMGWQPTSFIPPNLITRIVATDTEFTKGRQFFTTGNYEKALGFFESASGLGKKEAALYIGKCYVELGKFPSAA